MNLSTLTNKKRATKSSNKVPIRKKNKTHIIDELIVFNDNDIIKKVIERRIPLITKISMNFKEVSILHFKSSFSSGISNI